MEAKTDRQLCMNEFQLLWGLHQSAHKHHLSWNNSLSKVSFHDWTSRMTDSIPQTSLNIITCSDSADCSSSTILQRCDKVSQYVSSKLPVLTLCLSHLITVTCGHHQLYIRAKSQWLLLSAQNEKNQQFLFFNIGFCGHWEKFMAAVK